ncbi:uncharacterized protein NPIL_201031 [Nephila pilipes]|uniref:Uncharacterized protein n=1 Tax=Nephila pilipes TaxID=299642 RepID=A0A8X6NG50_NEPPI|nr:uncharacterized protein NPIL_201031 [Nephila pilipes]
MKNFLKAHNKEGNGFRHLREIFPKLNETKLEEGIFIGSQIRKVLKDPTFDVELTNLELAAWSSSKAIVYIFLGNRKDEDFAIAVTDLLENYKNTACRKSLKIHFLYSYQDFPQTIWEW